MMQPTGRIKNAPMKNRNKVSAEGNSGEANATPHQHGHMRSHTPVGWCKRIMRR